MKRFERITLYIALTALTAFAIDGILPTMPMIKASFHPASQVSGEQVITAFVLGMAIGELIIGPISDAVGRRPAVIAGLAVFVSGSVVAAMADSFAVLVFGRILQGIGVAGPKIGTRSMIRDCYAGPNMAKIMSVIFTLLILVPMIAPAVGAAIAVIIGWRGVFWAYLVLAFGLGKWLWVRHPETLSVENRVPLKPRLQARNIWFVVSRLDVFTAVIATGLIFGAQLTYFSVVADIFGALYGLPSLVPALFGFIATGTGAALLMNVWLVGRKSMELLILTGVSLQAVSGVGLLVAASFFDEHPPLAGLLCIVWLGFFALGLLFGNLNAFAMRPLGALAGLGSSIVASCSSLVAFLFATTFSMLIDNPVLTSAWSFTLSAAVAAALILTSVLNGTRKQADWHFRRPKRI